MSTCPKCGTIINSKDVQCPNCQTSLSGRDEETLDFPKLKKSILKSSKAHSKQSLAKTTNLVETKPLNNYSAATSSIDENETPVNLKPIPLKVKKTNHVPSNKNKEIEDFIKSKYSNLNNYYQEEDKLLNLSSILKVFIVILLLIITVTIIIQTALESTKKPQVTVVNEVIKTGDLLGKWQTNNSATFIFNEDSSFYWYRSADDLKNNYYGGVYTYKKGDEALAEMGYDDEEFTKTFGQNINKDNIYSLEMQPTVSYENGLNTSSSLTDSTKWWYILIIKKDGTAMAYNKTLDIRYNLIKK